VAVKFDDNLKNQIRQATDVVDLVSEYMSLTRKGKEWVGVCPFHQDHRPSMYVSPAKQIFKCFACGAAGDVFKFVQMRENISFPDAVERLGERVGIKLEHVSRPQPAEGASSGIDGKGLAKVNQWALGLWKQNFSDEQKGQFARNYLAERQISMSLSTNGVLDLQLTGGMMWLVQQKPQVWGRDGFWRGGLLLQETMAVFTINFATV
jgi:DNA primase